jgi:alkylation response protein AidB-like acyl-CoA dehydrogenase
MDFNYSEEQQMLADTLARFVEDAYPLEARRRLVATKPGFSPEYWEQFAELGLLGLNVPEQYGGLNGTPADTLIVMQAFGRGLVLEPYLSTAVLGVALLSMAGSEQQKSHWLPAIAAGSRRVALATLEPEARFDLWQIGTRAGRTADAFILNGRKSVVLHGDSADALIVSARTSGAADDREGITLFLVDANAAGVGIKGFANIDGQRSAEVTFENVILSAGDVIAAVDQGYEPLEFAIDTGIAALCAEAVGCMEKLLEITAEYLRTRTQFGRTIGTFQALQHRIADMAIAIEQARSAAYLAAARVSEPDALERRKAVSAAKALIGRSGRYVGQQAVQLHGGMGMTDELAVGHYFKRLTCIDMTWGNSEHHIERYGETL